MLGGLVAHGARPGDRVAADGAAVEQQAGGFDRVGVVRAGVGVPASSGLNGRSRWAGRR